MAKLISAEGSNRSTQEYWAWLHRVAPLTSAELINAGVRPELLASLALRRVARGGVASGVIITSTGAVPRRVGWRGSSMSWPTRGCWHSLSSRTTRGCG